MEHKCNGIHVKATIETDEVFGWTMTLDGETFVPVIHCPWCGEKLEVE